MDDLKQRVADKAMQPVKGQRPIQTIREALQKMEPEFRRALPRHLTSDRLIRIALTTIRENPVLLDCDVQSLIGGVMQAAQLGLEPGLLGHCYLVPFNRKRKDALGHEVWSKDVQFIIGYRGYISLAQRSGQLLSIYAEEVHEKDHFEWEYGLNERLSHKPASGDRGPITHYYAYAMFKDGGHAFKVMSKEDIEERRQRSKAKDSGPWVTDYNAMARKTVIRALVPFLPLSAEIVRGIQQDESIKAGLADVGSEKPDFGDGAISVPYEVLADDPPAGAPAEPAEAGKLV